MNKRIISAALGVVLIIACIVPAYAFDVPEYRFDGAKNDELYDNTGTITAEMGTQVILPDDTRETVLPYGVTLIGASYAGSGGGAQSQNTYTIGADGYPDVWANQSATIQPGYFDTTFAQQSAPYQQAADVTQAALTQKDGSLGSLSIPAIKLSTKLHENDMSKGVGHIPGTAFWNGNVGIMGHNRGGNAQFAKLKDLKAGDVLTYTTNQGTRNYIVTFTGTISSTDWSYLAPTTNNRLTLITCVMNTPSLRQCVQAVEVR